MKTTLIRELASRLDAALRCAETGNPQWLERHQQRIAELCDQHLPHGSGIDGDRCRLLDASKPNRLIFGPLDFHHMDDNGMYDGWTEHTAIVTPSLQFGFEVKITGRDRNQIKDYLHEIMSCALAEEIDV